MSSAEQQGHLVHVVLEGDRVDAGQRINLRIFRRHRARTPRSKEFVFRRQSHVRRRHVQQPNDRILFFETFVTVQVGGHVLLAQARTEVEGVQVCPVDEDPGVVQLFESVHVARRVRHHEQDDLACRRAGDQDVLQRAVSLRPVTEHFLKQNIKCQLRPTL